MTRNFTPQIFLAIIFLFVFNARNSFAQEIIYQHNFGTTTISGKPYTVASGTLDPNLSNSSWTTSAAGFKDLLGSSATPNKALSIENINGNQTYTLTFDVASGYICNITSFSFWRQKSGTGPTDVSMKINGISVGSWNRTLTTGLNIGLINVSGLINLTGTIRIELSLTGSTGSMGTFRLDDFTLNGSVINTDIETVKSGNWNDGSTWVGGIVPTENQTVLINEDHAVYLNFGGLERKAATYVNGAFQFETGSWVNSNLGQDFKYGLNGSLNFNTNGEYGVNQGDIFWPWEHGPVHVNVLQGGSNPSGGLRLNNLSRSINGTLNLSSGVSIGNGESLTINGTCQINTGGWVTNSLIYGAASTLIYNTNTNPYNNGNEWTPTSNPAYVVLKENTILNYPAIGAGARSISGSLTIEEGSALYMDYGPLAIEVEALTIGDLFLSGNLSLGNQDGGDLKTTGNLHFLPGSNFYPNNRAIFFIKDGTQTVDNTSAIPLTIPYVIIGKTGGSGTTVQMNTEIFIPAPNTVNAIAFTNAGDVLDINNHALTIGTISTNNQIAGPGSFKGSATSKMTLLGNGIIGTLRFSTSQELANLTINRTGAEQAVLLGSPLTIHSNLVLTNGHIHLGANDLQLQTAAIIGGGGANSYILANGAGKLIRYFNAINQLIELPVGGSQYSPIKYQVKEGNLVSDNTYLSVHLSESRHPQNLASASYLNRYWNTSAGGLTNYKADIQFFYQVSDVAGTETDIISAAYDNTLWQMDNPANVTNHFISFTGTDDLNRSFTGGDQFSPLASQPTNYFRSRATGNWNAITTWESSYDGVVWFNATTIPSSVSESILIRNSHIVTLTADATAKALTIESGGTLTNSGTSGGFGLTISDDGTSEPDFKIYGTYLLFGKQPIFNSGATARVYKNGLVRVDENIGTESENFASSSSVTFNTGAVFEWNIDKSFKTSGVTYFPNSGFEIPVFRVSINPGSVGTGVLTINGILHVNVDFTFMGGSNKTFRNGIVGNSTLTQHSIANNRFTISGSNAILGGSFLRINLSNPMHLNSSVTVPMDSSVIISGAGIDNNQAGNVFSIVGTLDVTDITITNTAGKTIIVSETGTYRTANSGGFSGGGSSIPSLDGTVSLQPGSTVEFYRSGDQTFFSRSDFSNLIFSGSGIKKPSSGFDATGTITIKDNAILDSRGYNIGSTNTNLTMTDNSRFIVSTTGRNPQIDGVYNLIGGVIQFDNSDGTKQTVRGTTSKPVAGTSVVYNQIEVTGSNVGIGNGNINLREGGKFTLKSGGVFEINQRAIKGEPGNSTQQVIIEDGAEFKTGSQLGFHGLESGLEVSSIHPNITNIDLRPNSTVNYYREHPTLTGGAQIITATVPYHHLIISGNEEKTAQLDGTIEIKGNLTKTTDASFIHNNSTVVFSGSAAQEYKSAYPQMVFNNLTNENTIGLNIQDSLSVFRALTLGENSKLNILADITLQSNAEGTANVAPIPENATITYGNTNRFIVERYIPDHYKAWQLLAAPVHGDQSIHQAWQEGMAAGMSTANNNAGAPGNLKPGYGTTITSDRPTWEADGFDKFTAPGPSLKTYNSATNKWVGVSSTTNTVQNKEGYLLMVRGDRSVIEHNQTATATTLRTRGKIYAPAVLPATPSTTVLNTPGTFVSVGNPYASAINFYSTNRSNLGESYIIWDPQLTNKAHSQYGLGAYRTISNGYAVPSSDNYVDGNIPPIQSGQAFFVQIAENASADGFITFTENAKTSESRSIFRGGNTFIKPDAQLRVNLYLPKDQGSILLDGNLVQLHHQYSAELDQFDAVKMLNTEENIGIFSNSKTLAIERKPLFAENDTIFYSLSGVRKQNYELEFIAQKTDVSGLDAYVEDLYLNKQSFLDPSGTTRINFEVNNDDASYSRNRFRVIFKDSKGPLPVTITQFTAELQKKEVVVQWRSENESGIDKYIVEKSEDGVGFNPLTVISAKNEYSNQYQITDKNPYSGNNYYRLKILHQHSKTDYSEIVKVAISNHRTLFSLRPNPVIKGKIHVHFSNQSEGMYSMKLLNVSGQSIVSKNIYYNGQTTMEIFNIENQAEGIYYLEIVNPDGERTLLKVIK